MLQHLQYLLTECVQSELGDKDRACVRLVRYLRVVVRLARARYALPRKLSQKWAHRVSHSDLTYCLCLCRFVRARLMIGGRYQSGWSGPWGNEHYKPFHCPYAFGILLLVS